MPPGRTASDSERIQREKQFHNHIFDSDDRGVLGRYYSFVAPAVEYFRLRIFSAAEEKTVLEYGCGPGTYSFQLAPIARQVIGIDISEVAIEKARQRALNRAVSNVQFHVMVAEHLSFPDATFDLVCG